MSDFLEGADSFFDEPVPVVVRRAVKPAAQAPKTIDGRPVLYRYVCPLCGGSCRVKAVRKGYPKIFCITNSKWVECVYVDI